MKKMSIAAALIGLGSLYLSGEAMAACTGKPLKPNSVEGYTLCTSRGKDSWQEYHERGGRLIDYKMGPSDKIDPTKQVGTWTSAGNNIVYQFGSTSSSYRLFENGGTSYCMNGNDGEFAVTFRRGLSKCSGTAPVALAKEDQGRDDRSKGEQRKEDRESRRY